MPTHIEVSETDHKLLAIAAARFCFEGLNQKEIAARLRRSQPEVSRLLAFARGESFLAPTPAFLKKNVKREELEEVERRFFLNEDVHKVLSELAPRGLHLEVHVVPDGDEAFTNAAAGCVVQLLQRARVVGVMWGRRAQRLVSNIRAHVGIFKQVLSFDTQCVPLCGDPVHLMNLGHVKYSSSHLAAELGQALNPKLDSDQPCLVGVPAYLPLRLLQNDGGPVSGWEHFVREIPGHRAIFGPANGKGKPWIDRVDTIISGTGIIAPGRRRLDQRLRAKATAAYEETGDFIRERIVQEEGITEEKLAPLVFGDIGGWLLERPGLDDEKRDLVAGLNKGWTGVNGDQLKAVGSKAKPDGSPGIIVIAAGAAKAEMLKELVRRGLVNTPLIDYSLAKALMRDTEIDS